MMRMMPTIPAPTAYRDRDNLSMEQRGLKYADMLEEKILAEGPESVLAFIMEPIGGAATNALVAPDSYYPRIREICDRYGILLIHDEVMSGVGAHRQIPRRRPLELPARHRRAVEGHRLGLCAARRHGGARSGIVRPVLDMGGFQHGHTYAGNPLACAAGLAVLQEIDRLEPDRERGRAWARTCSTACSDLAKRFPFIGDVRGKGLLHGDRVRRRPGDDGAAAAERRSIGQRVLDLAYDRGLIVYFRRVKGGVQGDSFMVAPPLIVTARADRRDRRDPRRLRSLSPRETRPAGQRLGRATMAPRKVIITCAVTGSVHTPSMSPYLPVTPDQIAARGDRRGRSRRLDPASPRPRSRRTGGRPPIRMCSCSSCRASSRRPTR